jgi:hypothetical protein
MGTLVICPAYIIQTAVYLQLVPFLCYFRTSAEAFRLGFADIQLLRCGYPVPMITQKDIFCTLINTRLYPYKRYSRML